MSCLVCLARFQAPGPTGVCSEPRSSIASRKGLPSVDMGRLVLGSHLATTDFLTPSFPRVHMDQGPGLPRTQHGEVAKPVPGCSHLQRTGIQENYSTCFYTGFSLLPPLLVTFLVAAMKYLQRQLKEGKAWFGSQSVFTVHHGWRGILAEVASG